MLTFKNKDLETARASEDGLKFVEASRNSRRVGGKPCPVAQGSNPNRIGKKWSSKGFPTSILLEVFHLPHRKPSGKQSRPKRSLDS